MGFKQLFLSPGNSTLPVIKVLQAAQFFKYRYVTFVALFFTMKIVPLFKVKDMKRAIAHYTGVLDFELKYPHESDGVVDLVKNGIELQLTIYEGDYLFGSVANILADEVDELFKKYLSRGLDTSGRENSPVHKGPTDQSWGRREFYVTDADGNTLRFCTPIV